MVALSVWPCPAYSQQAGDAPVWDNAAAASNLAAPQDVGDQPGDVSPAVTMFPHPAADYWISGQINIISQAHGAFPAAYSGPNSFQSAAQNATSEVLTLYTGVMVNSSTQVLLDIESAGGRGLSNGAGLGGFTDLDIVRTPNLGRTPYLARFLLVKTIGLGGGTEKADRGFMDVGSEIPAHRLSLYAGKFSTVDFFDLNSVGSDSHLQFMNWAVDNNGAYDYAANTRGYTWGAVAVLEEGWWGLRFGEAMMPKVANGENLDANLTRAHSENLEYDLRPALFKKRASTLRLLTYVNHADMGDYREAIHLFEQGLTSTPNIIATRQQGRVKYGFGVNAEQEVGGGVRLFGRWGWNNGTTESFAYTEVDRTIEFGGDVSGADWKRPLDRAGSAYVVNGLSGDHREYLALGGLGFILGDGALSYGLEHIFETYYTFHLWSGLFASADAQHVQNPGYNRVRGPVWVPSLRLHVDF